MGEQKSGKQQQNNFAGFLAKMMRLPLTAFANGLEIFVKTFNEIQRIADDGVELFTGGKEPKEELFFDRQPEQMPSGVNAAGEKQSEVSTGNSPLPEQSASGKKIDNSDDEHKTQVNDRNLRDDLLKLVRYKVLFVKREYEHAFAEQEGLIAENLDDASFTAWKAAEFIQRLANGSTKVPEKWLTRNYPPAKYRAGTTLKGLPEEDKKYLRVFYQVVERYPREKFKFEEQQIEVLEQISDNIKTVAESEREKQVNG